MKKTLYLILTVVLLIVFGVSAFFVGRYVIESKREADRFNQLAQIKDQATAQTTQPSQSTEETVATTAPEETTEATTAPTEPQILEEYAALYEMNHDMVGWIQIEGTKLNYPVMQTPNELNYYLYRNFDKADSQSGAIYAREDCDINEPSDNITIYGHNMANGSMFATLNSYTNKNYWENNNIISFDTLTEKHTYKIFAVFKTSANIGQGFSYHQFVDAQNEAEFNEFVSTCKKLAFYDTGITPVYGDKLICLSTCEYTLDNGRLVVCAVRWS